MASEQPGDTALIVPVPEAEALIGALRREHTPSGRAGMPAHVTLIAQFAHAAAVSRAVTGRVGAMVSRFAPFFFTLARVERFDDVNAVYLAPEPAHPFVDLTAALFDAFPEYPPEAGAIERVIPHVTVASRVAPAVTDAVATALPPKLPIHAVAERVLLVERNADLRWQTRASYSLGMTAQSTT